MSSSLCKVYATHVERIKIKYTYTIEKLILFRHLVTWFEADFYLIGQVVFLCQRRSDLWRMVRQRFFHLTWLSWKYSRNVYLHKFDNVRRDGERERSMLVKTGPWDSWEEHVQCNVLYIYWKIKLCAMVAIYSGRGSEKEWTKLNEDFVWLNGLEVWLFFDSCWS